MSRRLVSAVQYLLSLGCFTVAVGVLAELDLHLEKVSDNLGLSFLLSSHPLENGVYAWECRCVCNSEPSGTAGIVILARKKKGKSWSMLRCLSLCKTGA